MSKSLVIFTGTNFAFRFWEPFSRHAREAEGYDVHILAAYDINLTEYRQSKFPYHIVGSFEELARQYGAFPVDREKLTLRLRALEAETGERVTDYLQSDRHLGKGYVVCGFHHPSSNLSRMSNYWDSLAYIVQMIEEYDRMFESVRPEILIMDAVASIQTKMLCVCARRHGVAIRFLRTSRNENYFYWSFDEYERTPIIKEEYQRTPPVYAREEIAEGYAVLDANLPYTALESFTLRRTLLSAYRRVVHRMKEIFFYYYRGIDRFPMYDVWQAVRVWHFRRYFQYRKLNRIIRRQKESIVPGQYVYYPLHLEPEASTMVLSPMFNNQIALIDGVAKSLPAGVMLVVKEHMVAIGPRPSDFYQWLSMIPNVILAPPYVSGPALARESLCAVTITGTAGMEAAISGIPVITFCPNNFYNVMEHVHVVSDFMELRNWIARIVLEPQDRVRWKADGQRFLQAMRNISVDLGDEIVIGKRKEELSAGAITQIWESLKATLEWEKNHTSTN